MNVAHGMFYYYSLIQSTLGCMSIQEFSLNQDSQRIFRSASRLSKCKCNTDHSNQLDVICNYNLYRLNGSTIAWI